MLRASPCLELARRRTIVTVIRLPEGTSEGDNAAGLFERAFIRRMFPSGRGKTIIDQESRLPPNQVPQDQFLEYCDNMGIANQPNVIRDRNVIVESRIGDLDVRTTVSPS